MNKPKMVTGRVARKRKKCKSYIILARLQLKLKVYSNVIEKVSFCIILEAIQENATNKIQIYAIAIRIYKLQIGVSKAFRKSKLVEI